MAGIVSLNLNFNRQSKQPHRKKKSYNTVAVPRGENALSGMKTISSYKRYFQLQQVGDQASPGPSARSKGESGGGGEANWWRTREVPMTLKCVVTACR